MFQSHACTFLLNLDTPDELRQAKGLSAGIGDVQLVRKFSIPLSPVKGLKVFDDNWYCTIESVEYSKQLGIVCKCEPLFCKSDSVENFVKSLKELTDRMGWTIHHIHSEIRKEIKF